MGTTLVAINHALKAANIRVELVKQYAGKHEFVGPDAPKLNTVVTYTPLNSMSPDEWVALYRDRAAERMPDISNSPALANWTRRNDLDMTGAFIGWDQIVRTNGKHKQEFQQKIASRYGIESRRLLLMRPSLYRPGWDKSGQGDTHMGALHWFLSFAYQAEIVEDVRQLPSRYFSRYTKEWAIPVKGSDELISKIGPYFSVIVDTAAESAFCRNTPESFRESAWSVVVRWLSGSNGTLTRD